MTIEFSIAGKIEHSSEMYDTLIKFNIINNNDLIHKPSEFPKIY